VNSLGIFTDIIIFFVLADTRPKALSVPGSGNWPACGPSLTLGPVGDALEAYVLTTKNKEVFEVRSVRGSMNKNLLGAPVDHFFTA
jgi:hypothetical protein